MCSPAPSSVGSDAIATRAKGGRGVRFPCVLIPALSVTRIGDSVGFLGTSCRTESSRGLTLGESRLDDASHVRLGRATCGGEACNRECGRGCDSSDSHARRVCDFRRRVNGLPVRVRPLVGQEFDSLQMVRVRNFGARPLHFATRVKHLRRSAGGRDAIAHPVASVGHRLRTGVSSTPAVFRRCADLHPQPPSLILQ